MKFFSYVLLSQLLATHAALAAEETEAELEFEGVAEVEAPPREPTKHTLTERELTTIPGTRGDALRTIEIMPGVGRTQFATNPGPPLLRGSPSEESLVLFDGAQVPLIYHFGGLTSVFNSHLLERVTLYPGNFSARYGRAAGGAVEVQVRDPKSDRAHFMLELSALDSFAIAEAPLGNKTSFAVAARRSNIDLFFEAALDDDSTSVIAAPVYWDYQAIVAHRFNEANKLRVLAYGSFDSLQLYLGKAAADDPALHGELGTKISFHRLQLELGSRFSDVVSQELMVSVGPSPGRGALGSVNYDYLTWEANAAAHWGVAAAPWLHLDAGVDVQALWVDFRYQGPAPAPAEGVPTQGSLASDGQTLIESQIQTARPGAYVEASLRPARQLLFVPGVRADYYADAGRWSLDPRLSSRLELSDSTALKAGAGFYSQPPQYWEVLEGFGNPRAKPFRTVQTTLGVEHAFGQQLHANLDGFYKHWSNRVVGTRGGAPPAYVNGGTGNAYGAELLVNADIADRYRAFASYTLSRSTRRDGRGEPTRLFDRDQTHNLSLGASFDLGHGWQTGARFRYVTGNPYSPVQGATYDASSDTYRPLYRGLNRARNTAFHQLDLRLEKLWRAGPVGLTTYLEVMNVYNAKNEEGRRYSFDYQESASVLGMPLFPNLGVRGEL